MTAKQHCSSSIAAAALLQQQQHCSSSVVAAAAALQQQQQQGDKARRSAHAEVRPSTGQLFDLLDKVAWQGGYVVW
jgi:hypothetical protein